MKEKFCKHCNSPLVIKETKKSPSQLEKKYYYTAYYSCPNCKRLYHSDEFKIVNKENESLFDNKELSIGGKAINIWTDGACVGNGQKNAKAAWAFVSGKHEESGRVVGKQTNNTAEGYAIYHALLWAAQNKHKEVRIHSDSQISLYNLKKLPEKVKENREIFIKIDDLINTHNLSVKYVKVLGHSGDVQNERVDKLANSSVDK